MKTRLNTPKNAPVAARIETIRSAHGKQWLDHYAWMRADNWREVLQDPATLPASIADYLKAENDYYDKATASIEPLIDEIAVELRGRIPERDESIPRPDGPYQYQFRLIESAEYGTLVRTDLQGECEEIVFDINAEASGYEYFDFGGSSHSPDHSKLLWCSDISGAEFFTLYIREIATGFDKDYVIENVEDAVWGDDQTIFYTRVNSDRRILQVYKHVLDTHPEQDVLVFNETDERFCCSVSKSFSREYIFIQVGTFEQDEWWFIPINDLHAEPKLIQERAERLEYSVDHQGDRFVIETNANGAIDWKLVETPVVRPSMKHWSDIVPHQTGRMIAGVLVCEEWVVWCEVVDALPQLAYMDKAGAIKRVMFNEEAYSIGIGDHFGYRSSSFMFRYSSPTTPWETYEFNLQSAERTLLKQQVIPSGHNPQDYVTRRFSVASHDGAEVPVTLLYRRDTPIDGSAPVLLEGYGCYGASSVPGFSAGKLPFVERGFIFATAHVRGGSEKGMGWHEDAKLERKANSFHDFIAVGDALVAQGFCTAGNIVAQGCSAGGLLVTASMNMKPELFAGVIADVPDTDVLNLMLDDTLPGVIDHWPEWGNPSESKTIFDAIRRYSPYENSKAMTYPALYVTAGVSDPRVFHWQPAKWVANIRALNTGNNIVLFKTNMCSGHFGKTGRYAQLQDDARMIAFAVAVTSQ